MKNIDLTNVQEATDFPKLTQGGYICRITAVEDVPTKEYLKIEYDIVEGEFTGYWKKLYDSKAFWGGNFIKSYKETALPFFKAFTTAVEKSNPGYVFDNDETKLKGKMIGLILGEETYTKNDGSDGKRIYVDKPRSVEQIRKGDFTIPAGRSVVKKDSGFNPVNDSDEDMPF